MSRIHVGFSSVLLAGLLATGVAAQPVVTVTNVDSPDPVTAGSQLTYTITVTNAGPGAATDLTLNASFFNQRTFVSFAAPAGFTITNVPAVGGTGSVTATTPSFDVGSAEFTLVVRVNPNLANGITMTHNATVNSPSLSPVNVTGTATTTVLTAADLSVSKADFPDPVVAGANLTYTLTAENAGPSDAQNVTLRDVLPANTTFVSATQTSGPAFTLTTPPVGGTGTFSAAIAPFPTETTAIFELVVRVDASASPGTPITNTASIGSVVTADPETTNDAATETTAVIGQADLTVDKTDSPDPVAAGSQLTYLLTLSNGGISDALDVSLTDAVPAGTTFVSATQTSGPAFTLSTPPVGGTGTVSATAASFAAGATATFSVVVAVDAALSDGTIVTNTAAVTSATTDPVPADNSSTTTTTVTGAPDLAVDKTDAADPVAAGDELTYTLTLTNGGSGGAEDVSLDDPLPAHTTFVSATQTSGPAFALATPAVGGTGTFRATIASFAAGAEASFELVVRVDPATPPGTVVVNTATATATTADASAANDSASASTTVLPAPAAAEIPTLSGLMLLLLIAGMAAAGWHALRAS